MSLIQFANPKAEYLEYQDEFQQIIKGVLEKGEYILGTEVTQFEAEFAAYIGSQFALGVASGQMRSSSVFLPWGSEPEMK